MKKKIENISDLKNEIKRFEALKMQQEQILKEDVMGIKESLTPINIINSIVDSFMKPKKGSESQSQGFVSGIIISIVENMVAKVFAKFEDKMPPWAGKIANKVKSFFVVKEED